MARNPVQFQKEISLTEFLSLHGTEGQCFDALFQWRCRTVFDALTAAMTGAASSSAENSSSAIAATARS